jgi:hypothetical protein
MDGHPNGNADARSDSWGGNDSTVSGDAASVTPRRSPQRKGAAGPVTARFVEHSTLPRGRRTRVHPSRQVLVAIG